MEELVKTAPRETAGSATLRAYDFQIHVSMDRILQTYEAGKEFVAIFDHQDDLVLIEGEAEEPQISFFQVKSSTDKVWTATRLANRASKGDLPRSIVGKSYYNARLVNKSLLRACILSNQPLHGKLAAGGKITLDHGEIPLFSLVSDDTKTLLNALNLDFPGVASHPKTDLLTFERVPLDLISFRDTIFGRVAKFAENLIPGAAAITKPFYEAFLSEAGRCTGNTARPATFEELKARKGISREDIDRMIDRAQNRRPTVEEWWPSVMAELAANGATAIGIQRIKVQCLAYWAARQRGVRNAVELSVKIRADLDGISVPDELAEALTVTALVVATYVPPGLAYDLNSALIVEIMENIA